MRADENSFNRRLDQICDQFEQQWSANSKSGIGKFLVQVDETQRDALLVMLLEIDIELGIKNSNPVSANDYLDLGDEAVAIAKRILLEQEFEPSNRFRDSNSAESSVESTLVRGMHEGSGGHPIPHRNLVSDFGDYEIVAEIARGGMGIVYRARQKSLDRPVAIKMIISGQFADNEQVLRFQNEARSAAKLDHPGIVPIFEIGSINGDHFFSMGLVEGQALSDIVAKGPMQSRDAANLVKKISVAIAYAHRNGVIHRDLKPGNVLIDQSGEPRITDFGLAKSVSVDSGLTVSGQILGTPSYMSPEQVSGASATVDGRADVYALGAVMYELLTGRPPFRAATLVDTMVQILENDPAPVRLLNPDVDRDLETICLKCLAKEKRDRYLTADDLAADLNRYLSGEEISARSFGTLERLTRSLERSQIDAGFEPWAKILFWFAAIVLICQLVLHVVISTQQPLWIVFTAQGVQFLLMALVVFGFRSNRLLPSNAMQRQLWSTWLAFLLTCFVVAFVSHALVGVIRIYDFFLYPYWSVVTGFAFLTLGGGFWGKFYLIGFAFLLLAIFLTAMPTAGPLAFGSLWAVSLVSIGIRLLRMSRNNRELSTRE